MTFSRAILCLILLSPISVGAESAALDEYLELRRSIEATADGAARAGLERQAAAARESLLASARRSSRLVIMTERRGGDEAAPALETARLVARDGRITLQALAGPRPQSPEWERAGMVDPAAYLTRASRETPCENGRPMTTPGTLYVVATPLGNLEDITLRALRVLKEVALIACEDTRRTRILLTHFGIHAQVTSYFEHNKLRKGTRLLDTLQAGQSVALVTDAGTPGISDPGFLLVKQVREAGIPVVPVPGPSAAVTALSAAGVPADRFVFDGFLPVKPGRRVHRLEALRDLEMTVVCYESPHRILGALEAIAQVFGERQIVVAREMTKQFEEIVRGPAAALRERFGAGMARGEFTLIIPSPRFE